jgi:hypothetical protein
LLSTVEALTLWLWKQRFPATSHRRDAERKEHPVSNLHAYADYHVTLNLVPSFGGIGRARALIAALAASIRTAIERRQTQRFIASLPDHLLQDFGYERDWDGTIRSLRDVA